ncbi:hypothetical protein VaNZ11_015407 [Volvox africanus]|uniref:MYND-type domain-containing protein n=1 Tax=Volvox africanus TaxID=51714 RepID=A0ABQ5SLJ6_9CHLO|nr:hypothetical protein VaNZ11_015407 [Volvox africanus]
MNDVNFHGFQDGRAWAYLPVAMAASQLWYVPHRPDLLLLAPCDEQGSVPCPGSMYVSVDHLQPPERPENKWRHPRTTAFLTCYGDISRQQPRVARCACGHKPCKLRGLQEGGGVPDELIPADWPTKYELPPNDPAHAASEGRRTNAVQLWLDCTARAEKELPAAEGQAHPEEDKVLRAAEVMLTDYLKGRVCYNCNVPSTKMQKCGRCQQARYCSKECQRAQWGAHKPDCIPQTSAVTTHATTVAAAGATSAGAPSPEEAEAEPPTVTTATAAAAAAVSGPVEGSSGDAAPAVKQQAAQA